MNKELLFNHPAIQSNAWLSFPSYIPPVRQRVKQEMPDVNGAFQWTERVTHQISRRCSLACEWCFLSNDLGINGRTVKPGWKIVSPDELSSAQLNALESYPGQLKEYFLLWAEPTSTPEASNKILREAAGKNIPIMLVTNGFCTINQLVKLFEWIRPEQIHKVNLSIDSMEPKKHAKLRGKPNLPVLETALKSLSWLQENGFNVKIQTTIWRENYRGVIDWLNTLFEKYWVRQFAFHHGSVETLPESQENLDKIVEPLAWRCLCDKLYAFRKKHDKELKQMNFPFIYFTERELRDFLIGDDAISDLYLQHIEDVEHGIQKKLPFNYCPAVDQPQVYVYGNDGTQNAWEISICQIHSAGYDNMHQYRFNPDSGEYETNTNTSTNQLHAIINSPYLCPAMKKATGLSSDRVMTHLWPLFHGCRFQGVQQIPYLDTPYPTGSRFPDDLYMHYYDKYK